MAVFVAGEEENFAGRQADNMVSEASICINFYKHFWTKIAVLHLAVIHFCVPLRGTVVETCPPRQFV
jgi:hypothetical protein